MIYEIPKESADVVMHVLKNRPATILSWDAKGFSPDNYMGMRALRFSVNGFKHKGLVYVCYNDATDRFDVFLTSDKMELESHYSDLLFGELVDAIDYAVESCTPIGDWYKPNTRNDHTLKNK